MKKYKFKIGSLKFFSRPGEHEFYLVEWPSGYIQGWHEWDQIRFWKFNWITFVLIEFEIERELGDGFSVELGLLGFRLRFYWRWKDSEEMKQLIKDAKRAKKDSKKGNLKTLKLDA